MRLSEADIFLSAFQNERAKDLVSRMMKHNYAEAILKHHSDKKILNPLTIMNNCSRLVDLTFRKINAIKDSPDQLFPLLYNLARNKSPKDPIWFKEFDDAYEQYKHNEKLFIRLKQLKPFLKGTSYCDIGCGGGDLVAFLKNHHRPFKEVAGIDVLDWRTESVKNKINFQMLDFSRPDTKSKVRYDTLTCIAVLHHVGNTDDQLNQFLQNLKSAMMPNGRLIVEEDVILPVDEIQNNPGYKSKTDQLRKDQPLFSEFLSLSRDEQKDAIILIDFLANSLAGGVPEMAFPCGFKSINEWTDLFKKNGFKVEDVKIQGFMQWIFNRSSHVIFVLDLEG